MLKRLFILALTVSTFSTAMAGPLQVKTAKELYVNLFDADQPQAAVEIQSDEIVRSLFESHDSKEIKEDLKNFSQEISKIDLAKIVNKQRLTKEQVPLYADEMSRRLVALGLKLDKKVKKFHPGSTKGIFWGAIIGAASGFAFVAITFGKDSFTNVNGSQDDLGSILLLGLSTGAGFGAGRIYDYVQDRSEKKALKSILNELKGHAQITLEQLKQSKSNKLVNELE
jgi:hypothetical protein